MDKDVSGQKINKFFDDDSEIGDVISGHVELVRTYSHLQTLGKLLFYDRYNALIELLVTLELPWLDNKTGISCIPEDTYLLKKRYSEAHGDHYQIMDVPDRDLILVHPGNYIASLNPKTGEPDSEGCILPGIRFADFDGDGYTEVASSGTAMDKIRDIDPDGWYIKIVS